MPFLIAIVSNIAQSSEVVLQSVDNLENDEFHSDEGNSFELIKIDQGCKIEVRFFMSYENRLYQYFFKNQLVKATEKTYRYHYQKDFEGSLGHVTDVYQHASAIFDIRDPNVKKDFIRYKALFPNQYLKRCET
ncbi:hypothetical protein G9F31_04040 [Acinetobacter sp. 187]|nr:hypothetical protein [Acinetobacter lanii]